MTGDPALPRFPSPSVRDEVRAALSAADFSDESLRRLFAVPSLRAMPELPGAVLGRRLTGGSPLELLARLFLLEVHVPTADALAVLGSDAVMALEAAGLIRRDGERTEASVCLMPVDGMLIAFDRIERRRAGRADFILDPGPSSRWVAAIAIRRPVGSTLDLGSGSGYQACLAAAHSARVTATDVTARAAAFSAFNAALNGLENVECLQGDLYSAVAGRRFDLILCNAPYVISPEPKFAYRDGPPGFCERVVREAPPHLAEGGFLQMSCNWTHRRGYDWKADLATWFEGTGCDAWVLRADTMDPANYALLWLDRSRPEAEQAAEMDRWLAFYSGGGIEAVSSGIVTLRPAPGRNPRFEVRDLPRYDRDAGETIARGMEARDFLARTADDDALLAARLVAAPELELQERQRPTGEGWKRVGVELRLTRGLRFAARMDPVGAALVGLMDGHRTLREAAECFAAAMGVSPEPLLPGLPGLARRLLELGLLLPAPAPGPEGRAAP